MVGLTGKRKRSRGLLDVCLKPEGGFGPFFETGRSIFKAGNNSSNVDMVVD